MLVNTPIYSVFCAVANTTPLINSVEKPVEKCFKAQKKTKQNLQHYPVSQMSILQQFVKLKNDIMKP